MPLSKYHALHEKFELSVGAVHVAVGVVIGAAAAFQNTKVKPGAAPCWNTCAGAVTLTAVPAVIPGMVADGMFGTGVPAGNTWYERVIVDAVRITGW
jgi:hypothetical protein